MSAVYSTVNQLMQGFAAHKRHDAFSFTGFEKLFEIAQDESGYVRDVVALDCSFSEYTPLGLIVEYFEREELVEAAAERGEDWPEIAENEVGLLDEKEHLDLIEELMQKKTDIYRLDNGNFLIRCF